MKIAHLQELRHYLSHTPAERRPTLFLIVTPDIGEGEEAAALLMTGSRVVLEGSALSARTLLEELETGSLFGKRALLCRESDKLSAACREVMKSYCARPNPTQVCCFQADSADAALIQMIDKQGIVIDLSKITPWDRQRQTAEWVRDLARRQGREFTPSALQQLVERVGTDRLRLQQECDKLITFVGSKKRIESEDVEALVSTSGQAMAWTLGQAILERRQEEALVILGKLLRQGDPAPHGLLTQLRSQFSTAYQLASMRERGADDGEIGRSFPQLVGKRLARDVQRAQGYGVAYYKRAIAVLAEADLLSKSQNVDMHLLLETVVVRLVTWL